MKLDEVLELMHLARRRYTTIEARVRRRFVPGLVEASGSKDAGAPKDEHVEAVDHLWFESPTTWRVDAESGPGAGFVNIHDADQAFRNFRFEDPGEGYGRGVYLGGPQTYRQVMWEPNMLIPEMWLESQDLESVAGREGIRVRAQPRPCGVKKLDRVARLGLIAFGRASPSQTRSWISGRGSIWPRTRHATPRSP